MSKATDLGLSIVRFDDLLLVNLIGEAMLDILVFFRLIRFSFD